MSTTRPRHKVRKVKAATKHARMKREGLAALGGYAVQLARQHGGCAICGRQPKPGGRRLCVDHDHLTGAVRGLLCHRCNRALGWVSDCADTLGLAALYLRWGWPAAIEYRGQLVVHDAHEALEAVAH